MRDTVFDYIDHALKEGDMARHWLQLAKKTQGVDGVMQTNVVIDALKTSKKYTFSEEFIEHTYDVSLNHIDKLHYLLASAKPSFKKMFLNDDVNIRVAIAEANRTINMIQPGEPTKTGYLVEDKDGWALITPISILPATKKGGKPRVYPLPFSYAYSYSGMLPDMVLEVAVAASNLLLPVEWGVLYGSRHEAAVRAVIGVGQGVPDEAEEMLRLIKGRFAVTPNVFGSVMLKDYDRKELMRIYGELILDVCGDGRYLITALAILSDVPITVEVRKAADRGRTKTVGRSVPKTEDNLIHLNVIKQRTRAATSKSIGNLLVHNNRMKWHRVRGHWVHYGRDCAGTQCQWPDTFSKRQNCATCGAKRTWRDDFEKGDPLLGKVEKDYLV